MPTAPFARVVVDCMGADLGPAEMVLGALASARARKEGIEIILVGQQEKIAAALAGPIPTPSNVSIVHASGEVPMTMAPSEGVRMKDSSIAVGLRLIREGKADAFVSPGNTGAVMATALLTLGRVEGVSRPAITTLFPSIGQPTVLLDAGANADCKPMHLYQFAQMGSLYAQLALNRPAPTVGLLSIGEERSKGNELIFEAQKLLKESALNFYGNVEGRDILTGTVDVVVTDGFTGNIVLKFAESIKPFLFSKLARQVQTNIFSRVAVFLLGPFLRRLRRQFDSTEAGGAPLLGVNGNVIICHGSSTAKAITNAVSVAYNMSTNGLLKQIHDQLIVSQGQGNEPTASSENRRDRVIYAATADDQR